MKQKVIRYVSSLDGEFAGFLMNLLQDERNDSISSMLVTDTDSDRGYLQRAVVVLNLKEEPEQPVYTEKQVRELITIGLYMEIDNPVAGNYMKQRVDNILDKYKFYDDNLIKTLEHFATGN